MAVMQTQDELARLSAALEVRTADAQRLVVVVRAPHASPRSGTVWRPDIVIASDQSFPDCPEAEIQAGAETIPVQVAGRDPGTNLVALRLGRTLDFARPEPAEPQFGSLALAFAAGAAGVAEVRLGIVSSVGPAWQSRAGGRIDRRISLDLRLSAREEGGPVIDAAGGLLGMSTAGPRGRALVIPAATIERTLGPLLAHGRIERGWLGAALCPVALSQALAQQTGQDRGLMVLRLAEGGPAETAGIVAGDIVLAVGDLAATHPGSIAHSLGPESVGREELVSLARAGMPMTVTVKITARPMA